MTASLALPWTVTKPWHMDATREPKERLRSLLESLEGLHWPMDKALVRARCFKIEHLCHQISRREWPAIDVAVGLSDADREKIIAGMVQLAACDLTSHRIVHIRTSAAFLWYGC